MPNWITPMLIVASLIACYPSYSENDNPSTTADNNKPRNVNGRYNHSKGQEYIKPPIPKTIWSQVKNESVNCAEKKLKNNHSENCDNNSIDYVEIESFRLAQESLLIQKSMERYAGYTIIIMILSIFMSIVGVWLLKRTLDATRAANQGAQGAVEQAMAANEIALENLEEAKRVNILQLKPYLEIGEPVASKFQGVGAEILFSVDIPIINTGPTPVTRAVIEISNFKLYVFIEGVRVTFLPTEHITSSEVYIKPTISSMSTPINPKGGMPYSQTIGSKFVREEPDAARLGDRYENKGFGFSFFATIRFKDISTTETDHRVLYFSVSKNTGSAELDGRGVTTPNEAVEADNGLFDKEY